MQRIKNQTIIAAIKIFLFNYKKFKCYSILNFNLYNELFKKILFQYQLTSVYFKSYISCHLIEINNLHSILLCPFSHFSLYFSSVYLARCCIIAKIFKIHLTWYSLPLLIFYFNWILTYFYTFRQLFLQ